MMPEGKTLYADVIVNIASASLDRPFQYRIPADLKGVLQPGDPVEIPFGNGNRMIRGYCIGISDLPQIEEERIKELSGIADKDISVEGKLIRLAVWLKSYYGGTMLQALKTVLPVRHKVGQKTVRSIQRCCSEEEVRSALVEALKKHHAAKHRVLQELLHEETLPYELVRDKLHVSAPTLKSLEKQGLIRISSTVQYRNPAGMKARQENIRLTEAQLGIAETVVKDYSEGRPFVYLLHGVTGSGKTAIYIETARRMVKLGKQVIVLIPEISLTYQTIMRFYREFGERVSVLHSGLSAGERFDQCERAKNGDLDVIIGPRSALFTPFPKVGLIIMDEEHEGSYKSENVPKYHAREAAIRLADLHGASVLLGSATPSVDSYYRAMAGEYRYFRLTARAGGAKLPMVHIADMRKELRAGNRTAFSIKLQELLKDRLSKNEQSMLFLNRRGYAGFLSCRECGYVAKCPHCDVSLSLHNGGVLQCHYCGHTERKPEVCPQCGSKYIMGFRAGTEQIEEGIKKLFPNARLLRMDRDTTRKKDDYERILTAFMEGEADILIGTQMIVKGHDFPKVTLVGILAADMSLSAPDFRAGERTFSLLTQAAGRSGRADLSGEVVIQTYRPEDTVILHASAQDYESFYKEEIAYRNLMQYPPVKHLLCVQITAKDMERAKKLSETLSESVKSGMPGIPLMGPSPGRLSKLNDIYRFAFYIKADSEEQLMQAKELIEERYARYPLRDEGLSFDPDPMQGF